jgi:tetratricopeptide (TPR) repeat protein
MPNSNSPSGEATATSRSVAVTVAGVVLLLLAILIGGVTILGASGQPIVIVIGLLVGVLLGYAGIATIRRRGDWRGWAGTSSWILIAIFGVVGIANVINGSMDWPGWVIIVAVLAFILWAIRQEPEPHTPGEDAAPFIARGVECIEKGEWDRAIEELDGAIRLDATDARAFYHRGMAYGRKGERERAAADLDRALTLKPGGTLKTLAELELRRYGSSRSAS